MLGRMIAGDQPLMLRGLSGAADYRVATKDEWDAVMANDSATLSGKIVEVTRPITSEVLILNRDIAAVGAPLTIRSANAGSSLARLRMQGTVRGVDFSGLYFQMTGWPATWQSCVQFGTGRYGQIRFINGTSFRHGYGPGLVDIDTAADLPEYERRNHVHTATTTSTAHAISWRRPDIDAGLIEFFNRGNQTVYVAFGGPGVVATTASTPCPPNDRTRLGGRNPQTDTHFAVLTASGTSEINARAEQGLANDLARAFFREGAANIEDIEIRNCLFRDLMTGAVLGSVSNFVIMDNDFDRIYSDVMAATPRAGGKGRVLRNIVSVQFCRSGIPENNNGDANDPHGDVFQMFGTGSETVRNVIIAGTRMRARNLRPGVTNQGMFISDNNVTPSFSDIYMISNTLIGGSVAQIASGEGSIWPISDYLVYGATVVNYSDPSSINQRIDLATLNGGSVYVGSAIAPNFRHAQQAYMRDRTVDLSSANVDAAAIFPNISGILTADSRGDIEFALTPAAQATGIGAVAANDAIDWLTTDPEAVVRWENVPSGVHWLRLTQQTRDAVVTLPLRKVLNLRSNQPVSVGPGTEWRKVAADGATELLGWNASPGTVEPGQFVQIRRRTALEGATPVQASITINGFEQVVELVTSDVPSTYLVEGAAAGFFLDTANLPAATNRLTFRGKFLLPATGWTSFKPFAQVSTGCDLTIFNSGTSNISVEDGTGSKVLSLATVTPIGGIAMGAWVTLILDVDQVAKTAVLTVNGTPYTVPFTTAGNGAFQTANRISMLAMSTGANAAPSGTLIADLSVEANGTLRKAISNAAANANSDPWKLGGAFTGSP